MEQNEDNIKNVYMMGYVSFFTDVSSEMVFSILPVYILSLPGDTSNLSLLDYLLYLALPLLIILYVLRWLFRKLWRRNN
ncbi:hypothetical protein GF326_12810 [Candidatus Bathyarchaeota archaeon]|nr:hypothetical protein [Candidatus Bathyarchaeota archaeon]